MTYLDTSVLAAYYCPEPLSHEAERLVRSRARPTISDLTEVELLSALARKVRARELALDAGRRIADEFQAHLAADLFTRLAVQRRHYETARDWIGRFGTALRTLDALHLAIAHHEGLSLATADQGLAAAGRAFGVRTIQIG